MRLRRLRSIDGLEQCVATCLQWRLDDGGYERTENEVELLVGDGHRGLTGEEER